VSGPGLDVSRKLQITDTLGKRELSFIGTLTVGRDPACEISSADPLLSRRHAEFGLNGPVAVVRDLNSHNGIRVNGKVVTQAVLSAGDLVEVAGFTIRYTEESTSPAGDFDDDKTIVRRPRPAAAISQAGGDGTGKSVDEDRTRFYPPPSAAASPKPAVDSASVATDEAVDEDRTRFYPPPLVEALPKPSGESVPAASEPVVATPAAAPAPAAVPARARAPRRALIPLLTSKLGWERLVLLELLALALCAALVTGVPLMIAQRSVRQDAGTSTGEALANWLGAEAELALQRGGDLRLAVDTVAETPGVIGARILSLDGRVVAPASRVAEQYTRIPALDAEPANIVRLRSAWIGDRVEIARPVRALDGSRAAVAWVTVRASEAGGSAWAGVMLLSTLILALGAGLFVADDLRRRTLRTFTTLSEDVELALAGQIPAVRDPIGAAPVRQLTDAINFLLSRLRTSEARPSAAEPPSVAGSISPVRTVGSDAQHSEEAVIEANPKYRVTFASPACKILLGLDPETAIGKHLVDAIVIPAVIDAVLERLSVGADEGKEVVVQPQGLPYKIALTVARRAKDQPLTIRFRPVHDSEIL
jgi:PAS domain-containing protein